MRVAAALGLAITALFLPPLACAAEITVSPAELDITIRGPITSDDPAKFRTIVANPKDRKVLSLNRWVYLNSPGGDAYAAMDIGRLIRAGFMRTEVKRGDTCVSACVFIFAAGVKRSLWGRLGIHRPYSTDTGYKTLQDADRQYKQMDAAVRAYFKEMNVSESLADDMLHIRSQDVKFLERQDADQYALNDDDPAYADTEASMGAETYGVSKAEYFRRTKRAERECQHFLTDPTDPTDILSGGKEFNECQDAIMYGISQSDFVSRKDRAYKECKPLDHPGTSSFSEVRREFECRRAVFQGTR